MSRVSKPSNLFIVPFSVWWDGFRGLITPALPPEGSDATLLGGLAGFTALASGLNWYVMNHYRDKGYGTGTGPASSPGCAASGARWPRSG